MSCDNSAVGSVQECGQLGLPDLASGWMCVSIISVCVCVCVCVGWILGDI